MSDHVNPGGNRSSWHHVHENGWEYLIVAALAEAGGSDLVSQVPAGTAHIMDPVTREEIRQYLEEAGVERPDVFLRHTWRIAPPPGRDAGDTISLINAQWLAHPMADAPTPRENAVALRAILSEIYPVAT